MAVPSARRRCRSSLPFSLLSLHATLVTAAAIPAATRPTVHGERGEAAARDIQRWHVVITWSRGSKAAEAHEGYKDHPPRDIKLVNKFPEEKFDVTVYAKGVDCDELPKEGIRNVSCTSFPNYSGREAHSILHHVAEYHQRQQEHDREMDAAGLERQWLPLHTATLFIQDDPDLLHRPNFFKALESQLPGPGERLRTCMCSLSRETFDTQYQYYHPMRFVAKLTDTPLPEDGGTVVWSLAAEFAVDAATIRGTSVRAMHRLMPYLTSEAKDHAATGMPENLTPAMNRTCAVKRVCISPLRYAHVMERMWRPFFRLPECGFSDLHSCKGERGSRRRWRL